MSRVYPWALIVAFVALSAWANSLHAPDAGVLRLMAGLVPVSAALCWHLLVRPGLAGGWRRAVSRLVALAVFAVSIAASFETLTAVGERAGLPLPWALPVALDGLATVAALSVWSARSVESGASLVAPSPDLSAGRVDSVRPGKGAYAARPDILPDTSGRPDLHMITPDIPDREAVRLAYDLPSPDAARKRLSRASDPDALAADARRILAGRNGGRVSTP